MCFKEREIEKSFSKKERGRETEKEGERARRGVCERENVCVCARERDDVCYRKRVMKAHVSWRERERGREGETQLCMREKACVREREMVVVRK